MELPSGPVPPTDDGWRLSYQVAATEGSAGGGTGGMAAVLPGGGCGVNPLDFSELRRGHLRQLVAAGHGGGCAAGNN